jgi:hypothetical protein
MIRFFNLFMHSIFSVLFKELLHQREQLENTESRLDEINNTLRFSQKHITSIKVIEISLLSLLEQN